eukprot:GHVR01031788.1.p1 GENE.GHVR01031788.1~~GHVR01031788.1.p1  ORF type:complete len:130 (+),score=22.42 GHVR01031788.1:339-728(+)
MKTAASAAGKAITIISSRTAKRVAGVMKIDKTLSRVTFDGEPKQEVIPCTSINDVLTAQDSFLWQSQAFLLRSISEKEREAVIALEYMDVTQDMRLRTFCFICDDGDDRDRVQTTLKLAKAMAFSRGVG